MNRDRIIAEIRRTAAANGGTPLGRMRFYRETGIRETDWSGRYWARWSDALAEAGFPPNAKQEPYDEHLLSVRLVEVIEALGKWPTTAELRLYAREHPGFPSHNTFRRLGNRGDLATLLLTHRAELALADGVLEICQKERRLAGPDPGLVDLTPSESQGFVYLLKHGKYHKVGRSNDPSRRAYEVRLQMPEQVKVVHRIETDDPQGIEAYWHRRFSDKRANGEWFVLSAADIAAFKSRTSM